MFLKNRRRRNLTLASCCRLDKEGVLAEFGWTIPSDMGGACGMTAGLGSIVLVGDLKGEVDVLTG